MTDKSAKIRQTLRATQEKRKTQTCRVFIVKIDETCLSDIQKETLKMMFVEAKWISNEAIGSTDLFEYTAGKSVVRRDKDGNEITTELKHISSQMKQSVVDELKSNVKTLSTLKRKGKKVGRIRFKKEVNSIGLKQFGSTHRIVSRNRISLQNTPGKIKVFGLNQILNRKNKLKFDMANAKLIKKPSGFYVAFTTYEKTKERKHNGKEIGIDFGISTNLTLSDGTTYHASVQESDRLKKLQKKFSRQEKGSKRRYKTLSQLKREYEKMTNKKDDIANKIVHEILKFEHIYMQDENLNGWKQLFGKQVHHSVMGRVKAKLIPHATHVLGRFEPTTKLCGGCGQIHEMKLSDRMFICDCGVSEDRDIHAAKNMIVMSKVKIGQELAKSTLAETEISRLNPKDSVAQVNETRKSV